jgi:hypothetical protein
MLTAFSQQVNSGLPTEKWWFYGSGIRLLVHYVDYGRFGKVFDFAFPLNGQQALLELINPLLHSFTRSLDLVRIMP